MVDVPIAANYHRMSRTRESDANLQGKVAMETHGYRKNGSRNCYIDCSSHQLPPRQLVGNGEKILIMPRKTPVSLGDGTFQTIISYIK